jgi:SecD/SecF fusion protein
MIYKRWQLIAIFLTFTLGLLFALPNVAPPSLLRYLPFKQPVYLGLDLKGGTSMQMQVDLPAVARERAETVRNDVRAALRTARIRYADLALRGNGVALRLLDANDLNRARTALQPVLGPVGAQDFTLTDLDGGRIALNPNENQAKARTQDIVQRSIEIIRRRIDETGVTEPTIAPTGADRITIELPGVQDPERLRRLLGTTAKMSFRMVDPTGDTAQALRGIVPPEDELLYEDGPQGQKVPYLIERRVSVAGEHLTQATAGFDSRTNEPVVNFRFDARGTREFGDVTKANVGKPFAIVLDNKVISAPVIREPILQGQGQISGNFSVESANELAVLLRGGALPAPLKVLEQRTVGPNLGADAIRTGLYAAAIGGTLVVAFMLYFYRLFGVFASIGLVLNLILLFAALSLLQASLTLPGIIGILLTLGMSVDANVLINERIREETRKGRSALAAIEHGFSRAMTTIIDSNMTTLLKMLILYSLAMGAVRGFAITISLGIITSMFTAIVAVRAMVAAWYRRTRPKVLKQSQLGPRLVPDTGIRFMRGRYAGLITSAVLSIGSLIIAFYPGLKYGIDFKGGIAIHAVMPQAADFAQLRTDLATIGFGEAQLQEFGSPRDVNIRLERQPGDDAVQQAAAQRVRTMLERTHPGTQIEAVDAVGGTVSAELFQNGLFALGIAMLVMLGYIWFRFEWQFGVAATSTLALDITKLVGLYALTGFQFNTTSIVAILTVMGYSINDKVVVYDRIRENMRLYRRMPLRELIDRSINETLGRTIATSLTVFLAILPMAVMAHGEIWEFSMILLTGIIIGTSSSIFISAPILLLLGQKSLRQKMLGADDAAAAEVKDSKGRMPAGKPA